VCASTARACQTLRGPHNASETAWRCAPVAQPPAQMSDFATMASERGITNRQASFLASLCRQAGEPYDGNGMTLQQAADRIDELLDRRAARKREWADKRAARQSVRTGS